MKKIIIACAVLVIAIAALVVVLLLPDAPDNSPVVSPTPIVYEAPVAVDFSDVTAIHYTANMGKPYTITLTHTGEDTTTAVLTPGRTGFTYNEEALLESAKAAVAFTNCTKLTDSPGDLTPFGFDEPILTWTIETADASYTVQMGGSSGGGEGVYIRLADSNDIYILPYTACQAFARAEYELRELSFLPDYADAVEATESLVYYSVNGTKEPFALRRLTEEEGNENPLAAMYQFISPTEWYVDSYYLNDELLTPFFTVSFDAVVEDDPTDLAQYGLDNPHSISVKDIRGWQATLLIGDPLEQGGRYVMQQGINTVFYDGTGDYSFLDINYATLINKLFWIYNLTEVSQVEYKLGDVHHLLRYDVTEEAFSGTYDGGPISEENGRRLYIQTLQTKVYDLLAADVPNGAFYGSIAITLRDGTTHTMELYTITDRTCNVVFDGEDIRLTIHKSVLENLLSLFAIIERGDTIPQ